MQTELDPLSRRYDVVVANPPYMGSKNMNKWLGDWIKKHYKNVKGDLFSCFMVRNVDMGTEHAQLGFMTPYVWMFIGTYEKLRKFVIQQNTITSLIQLEYSGFSGATVPICTFTLQKGYCPGYRGGYVRLSDFVGADQQAPRALEALANPDCGWFYRADANGFEAIPGSPIAYWLNERLYNAFQFSTSIEDGFRAVVKGVFTGNNDKFLRLWHEINRNKMNDIWRLYAKGGAYRKWYGNVEYVINWRNDAYDLKQYKGSGMGAAKYFGSYTLTWTKISSGSIAFRLNQGTVFFDDASPAFVMRSKAGCRELSVLAFLNSSLSSYCLAFLAPTLNYQCGDIKKLPFDSRCINKTVAAISGDCIDESIKDWDAFESSVDFKRHPLV